ncbi:hypothetical protein GWI33_004896 [Rhynchophorus ferrugineus]|uniref:CRAL-TRIO domain-containing protein n=1 Tax=Rhynchophorus ferrugineus TaxID=354439 RepID=A0A834INU4_RHYFE|nr:hypothetical protein GWI33_004896 [Rhynchophorus ferrugineus]
MSPADDKDSPLSDTDVQKYLAEVLNETEKNRDDALTEIRSWLDGEASWLHARSETTDIIPFLRGCKFDIERTKNKLMNYYTMRRDRPEWFRDRNPLLPNLQELIKLGVFLPLKKHDDDGRLVVIIRTAAHDPKRHHWNDVFKVGKMVLDVVCREDEMAQIYGVVAIFDMTGMSFAHYCRMTPGLIKNAVFAWQNYHVRPKKLEFVNSPVYINVALNVFKSFMTEKMRGRVKVHFGGLDKAQRVVSKDILPPEYGGGGDSIESLGQYWFDKLVDRRQWFLDDEKYKAQ